MIRGSKMRNVLVLVADYPFNVCSYEKYALCKE